MGDMQKKVNIRLDVTEDERNTIRIASVLAGYKSMADFSRAVVLQTANLFQPHMMAPEQARQWFDQLPAERRAWLVQQLSKGNE